MRCQWWVFVAAASITLVDTHGAGGAEVYLGMDFRVGEVAQNSAIVWTRITARSEPLWDGYRPVPADSPTRTIVENAAVEPDAYEGAMPGATGRLRIAWSTDRTLAEPRFTPWQVVDAATDFAWKFDLAPLEPATRYWVRAEATDPSGEHRATSRVGSFATPPRESTWQDVRFVMTGCQMYYERDEQTGFRIYRAMRELAPDFFIAAGDNVYYDRDNPRAKTVPLCRLHWNRMYALPLVVEFCRDVPGYWMKDDHDTFFDDCWRTYDAPWIAPLTYRQGVDVYREQAPIGERFYRTVRWGKGLQLWFVESRDYRSPNTMADGPDKTIWGAEQKAWLMASLLASDATFKILASPTAIVGPDNDNQKDNHANRVFEHEGLEFRQFVGRHRSNRRASGPASPSISEAASSSSLDHLYVVNGDRHWQYLSVDAESGLHEFSCGAASDKHAVGGPGMDQARHRFYRALGGFLSVEVTGDDARRTGMSAPLPTIAFRFHDCDGNVVYEHRETAK